MHHLNKFHLLFFSTIFLINIAVAQLPSAEIFLWDGSSEKGGIVYKRGTYKVVKKSSAKQINIGDVFEIRFNTEAGKSKHLDRITLTDGSKINADIGISSDFETLPITLANGTEIEMKGAYIQDIEFAELDPGAQVTGNPPTAHCISRNGKTLLCEIEWISNFDVSIKTKAGRLKLDRERIHKIGFARKSIEPSKGSDVIINTRYNDSLIGKLILIEDNKLQLQHTLGRLTYKLEEIRSIESVTDRVVDLTNIEAKNIKQTPFFDHIKEMQLNKNLFGGPLYLNGVRYDTGISMHTRTQADFAIQGAYQKLLVNIGLDTAITDQGQADFVILGDGKKLHASSVNGKDSAKLISIDIANIQTLTLLLDYGKHGSSGDHGIWGNPRLIK